ncbi:FAD-dependent monooxygenase [Colwellia sp. MB3u-28]|nr:FAD-dependent monooxygenase [Colwellia sp. MB02u-7]MBA6237783.1 FAD-dependent monooxygenase [Colwellia sp. MB02u-11]MBA6254864.1 FAD-dependent monooxygenase [Colwellia sp. MB3u-28]MBA6259818.1 FAD-dependent monooxygenase [Colwellia sp. MB3u-41]MBA6300966.1 FAD-dependent monooxygenase [Colwellia sp. MB3u-22]MBA6303573.1 FAD-dependent monooxygenase [Colwellia sp. MB02u-14]MBA6312397.1 FAD-dependent monooxygenase [Colwellia sp. MB3u-64]
MSKPANETNITVAGAGPIGALLAIILARKGYNINLFESRPDSRQHDIYQGKSINIALSDRGWLALEAVGIAEQVRKEALPMKKRVMHGVDGTITEQAYGKDEQAIWSVSRAGINEQLLNLAEKEANVALHFEKRLTHVDFTTGCSSFSFDVAQSKGHIEIDADYIFGADGAFSKVRRLAQETPRFSYSQSFMPQSYIELTIPANENETGDARFKMEKEALHIWPRKDFMLIALPNPDGSFTCTLFMNYESKHEGEHSFCNLTERSHVIKFFNENFADAMPILADPIDDFMSKKASPLFLVKVDPWVINNKVALIGDAAHAMVPYYGQGMNCGFEDCRELGEIIDQYKGQWSDIFPAYQKQRKINADAITELAQRNFVEMSELSGDSNFLLQKKIEAKFHQLHPELWVPLYSMVTFCPHLPYSQALAIGDQQKLIMAEIMQIPNINTCWEDDFIYQKLRQLVCAQDKNKGNHHV